MRDLLRKLDTGDSITDRELDQLIDALQMASDGLTRLNYSKYDLVDTDVYMKLVKCRDYKEARIRGGVWRNQRGRN